MDIFGVLTMLGGLALFLFGMDVMGDGLEKASGGRLEKILETDEAVGSRIYERTKRNGNVFDLGEKRNWRIEGV